MRILGYIHTFNDAEVIEQGLSGLRRQIRKPDAIVVVDNASTDGTLDRISSERVIIIRNLTNLGTSGAIGVGFKYALAHNFDWVWILDPDSVPDDDALENLIQFFMRLPVSEQEQVFFLTGRVTGEAQHRPMILTVTGGKLRPAPPPDNQGYSRCDCAHWSGTLYRMEAVKKIGLPRADYFIDWDELEYGYRAQQLGFVSFVVNNSVLRQDMGRSPGIALRKLRLGPLKLLMYDAVPLRCYYFVRNSLYFWLYDCKQTGLRTAAHVLMICFGFTMSFVIRPISRRRQAIACLRGVWDGLTKHIERRY
jgi:rhamnopyranosyl-N-acetylglucosaminyl-diphospho-decaprenol beta-1,3/1,4-galactofuranosyltransferase